MLTAQNVLDFLLAFDEGWVTWDNTVDTFKAGEPNMKVRGIAVGWKAHMHALQHAHDLGCNLFVCHEPLFYDHHDENAEHYMKYEMVRRKRDWLAKHEMAVVRCHDVWDGVQVLGITDTWASVLGFTDALPESNRYIKVYNVTGNTAEQVARLVLEGIRGIGNEYVGLIGNPDRPVTRCAIGYGAGTSVEAFLDQLKADICVVTDDGYTFWREGALAIDSDVPLIVVNHCVAEDYGMESMSRVLRDKYDVPVHFLPEASTVKAIY